MKIDIKSLRIGLINQSEPVQVTSIDFKNETLTWDFRGQYENVESFADVEYWEVGEV
ncbi:hypothetical protein D3C74_283030 [compost metagenome]